MKKAILGTILTATLFSISFSLNLEKIGLFGLGFASGVYVHEFGHVLTTWGVGGEVHGVEWAKTHLTIPEGPNKKIKSQIVDLGGYLSQSLMTEYILQHPELHKNDTALGLMYFGIFVNLNNVIRHYFFPNGNDLDYYEYHGGDVHLVSIIMVLYSLWTLDRIGKTTNINHYLSSGAFSWTFNF